MSRWNDEKVKTKDIFDCIRNFGLCGLVFFIGVLSFTKPATFSFMAYLYVLFGIAMILLSIYLFRLNYKQFDNLVMEERIAGNVGPLFHLVIPNLIIVLGLNVLVHTAFSINLEDGRTVGQTPIMSLIKDEAELEKKSPNKEMQPTQ